MVEHPWRNFKPAFCRMCGKLGRNPLYCYPCSGKKGLLKRRYNKDLAAFKAELKEQRNG